MQHLDEGTIHAWLDGALDAEEAAGVEQHAASCESCAAMVAEARGLVAGTSRILASLDHVPGGVIPKARSVRRPPRALWNVLHLTPARAAAAALVFVAAGTALVLRNRPNDSAVASQPFKLVSRDTITSRPVVVTAPAPAAGTAAAPRAPSVPQSKRVDRESSLMEAAVVTTAAPKSEQKAAVADAAKSAEPAAVGGAMNAAPRPAPMAARAEFAPESRAAAVSSTTTCYTIEGDSIPSLPRQVVLEPRSSVSTDARAPLPNWHWSPRPAGIRLWTPAPTAIEVQLDSTSTPGELRGMATRDGRQLSILFRRVDCTTR